MILNLLPPNYKQEQSRNELWHSWQRAVVLLAVVSLLSVGAAFAEHMWLQHRADLLSGTISQLQAQSTASQKENITTVTTTLNGTIKSLGQLVEPTRAWSHDLSAVMAIIPSDNNLQSLTLSAGGNLTLIGVARTRASFIALDEALKASPLLKNVKTTSTPSKRDNLPFTYSAVLIASTP